MSLLPATLSMPVKTRLMEEQARTTSSMAWRQSPTLAVSGGRWYSGHSKTAHTRWRRTTQPVRITSQGWIQRSLDTEMKKPGGEQSKLCITRWLEVMDVIKKISWQIWGEFYEQNSVFNHALERQWKSLRQTRRDGEGNLSSRQCPAFALLPQPQKDSCQSLTLSIAIFHRVGMTWLPTQIISGDIACYDIPGFVPIRRGQELFGAAYDMNSFGPSPHLPGSDNSRDLWSEAILYIVQNRNGNLHGARYPNFRQSHEICSASCKGKTGEIFARY